ncbi:MAG: transcription elongation factor GreAB [Mariprofundaceae bacterium]|nr:transcription elongation factor GreAB [Mariprofundaceae bacterium]
MNTTIMQPKEDILKKIIAKLQSDIDISAQAVAMARDTATHQDCLGSSKYETMGLEASYLAQGQGTRLLELERSLAYFKQIHLHLFTVISLNTYIILHDDDGSVKHFWLTADAGGLKISYNKKIITLITSKSPLGCQLLGKNVGDICELRIDKQCHNYEVVSVL